MKSDGNVAGGDGKVVNYDGGIPPLQKLTIKVQRVRAIQPEKPFLITLVGFHSALEN